MAEDKDKGEHDYDDIEAMRRRHLSVGLRFQAIAVYALEELEKKMASGETLGLTAEDAKTLLDAGSALERAALGEKSRKSRKLN
jgi:hypothetical protein